MMHRLVMDVMAIVGRPDGPRAVRRQAVLRTRAVSLGFAVMLSSVGLRGAWLCLSPHEAVVDANDIQRWGRESYRAPRGEILDRTGRALAATVVTPTVTVDPGAVEPEEREELARKLGELLDRDPASIMAQLEQPGRYARLKRDVHPATADAVRRLRHRAVRVERDPKRFYPEERLAAQVLGFVNGEGSGRSGLESTLDSELAGGTVVLQRRRDRLGRRVDQSDFDLESTAGHTVHTTLDRSMQRAAERALDGVVERSAPKSATAVVIDVDSGDILAMANAPDFNPNAVQADPAPRRNHAVQDWFEPGSVMKPFTFAAAIDAGIVNEHTLIDCEAGYWRVGGGRIRDDHPKTVISATQVMKFSSNIGSAKMALELGPEVFLDGLRAFGFGQRTGVPLPGELAGIVRHPDRIRTLELANTGFGQGLTVTAMQLAMGMAAIANDGVLMRPRLITEVTDADGLPEWTQAPVRVRRAVSADAAQQVGRMMQAVMEDGGTGRAGRVPGYAVAGKTGTAQKAVDGGYGEGRVSSFVGFLPADAPEVAIVVMVDEPSKGSRYGGTVAGPAFSEIGSAAMRILGIPEDPALLPPPDEAPAELVAVAEGERGGLEWNGAGWAAPDVVGLPLRDVLTTVQGAGLALTVEGSGVAVSQQPLPGESLRPGDALTVVFR